MACRKHNYKGSKPCAICGGEDWGLKDYLIVFIFLCVAALIITAVAFWYITIPVIGLIWWFVKWAEKKENGKKG